MNDAEIEPKLQKIDNEGLNGLAGDNAIPDIRARGVWRQRQNIFFDIRLTIKCYSEKSRKRKNERLQ